MSRKITRFTVARPSIAARVTTHVISTMTNAVYRFVSRKTTAFKRDTLIANIVRRGFSTNEQSALRTLRLLRARGEISYFYDRATKKYVIG